jgi:hypothetical protein
MMSGSNCRIKGTTKVRNCGIYDGDQATCDAATQINGKKCKYDKSTMKCLAEVGSSTSSTGGPGIPSTSTTVPTTSTAPPSGCHALDENACRASMVCTYDLTKAPPCQDALAAIIGKCEAIQAETPCNNVAAPLSCVWDVTNMKCESKVNPPKTVTVYRLSKQAKTALPGGYDIADDSKIFGISASGDGKYVYLIGMRAFNSLDENGAWVRALGDFTKIREARDLNSILDFSLLGIISKWHPLEDGLLLWMLGKGAVQLVGTGETKSFGWLRDSSNIQNTDATGLGEFKKGADHFMYMSVGKMTKFGSMNVFAKNVVFIKKTADAMTAYTADWDNSLIADLEGGRPLRKTYSQFLPVTLPTGPAMLMMASDGKSVDLIDEPAIGRSNTAITDSAFIGTGGETDFIRNIAWRQDGATDDSVAKKLAIVGNYLVSIFIGENPKTGGIASFDISVPGANPNDKNNWNWLGNDVVKNLECTDIVVDNHSTMKGKRAIITARSGFLILEEKADQSLGLMEPVAGHGYLINSLNTTGPDKQAIYNNYANARNGFQGVSLPAEDTSGGVFPQSYVGAAQRSDGSWLIAIKGSEADDGGIFILEMREEVVNP